jgi:hypothetical protein
MLELSPFCMWMTKKAVTAASTRTPKSLIALETMTCNVVHHSADAKEGVAPSSASASRSGLAGNRERAGACASRARADQTAGVLRVPQSSNRGPSTRCCSAT